jgi:oligoribonuclease (3'-5' exoribonuclease)
VTDDQLNQLGEFSTLVLNHDPTMLYSSWAAAKADCEMRFGHLDTRHTLYVPEVGNIPCPSNPVCVPVVVWSEHFKNGLVEDLRKAWDSGRHHAYPEDAVVAFLHEFQIEQDTPMTMRPPLCGSSVHFDRGFLKGMGAPWDRFLNCVSYQNVDVSTVKQLAKRWWPDLELPQPKGAHRALSDLKDSIDLLRFFREKEFICGP